MENHPNMPNKKEAGQSLDEGALPAVAVPEGSVGTVLPVARSSVPSVLGKVGGVPQYSPPSTPSSCSDSHIYRSSSSESEGPLPGRSLEEEG